MVRRSFIKSDIEEIFNRIKTHKSVKGIILMNKAQILRTTYSEEKRDEGDALGKSIQNLTGNIKSLIKELDQNVPSEVTLE